MSPEQALSDVRKTYTLCDMFSFGLIVKWLLVGMRQDIPFKDLPTDKIIEEHKRLHDSAGSLVHPYVEDLSLVPPVFHLLVQFCTATDASKRWTAPRAMWELEQLKSRLEAADVARCAPTSSSTRRAAVQSRHPENVDLIFARQQRVSADAVTSAIAQDALDLNVFKSQQFSRSAALPPSASSYQHPSHPLASPPAAVAAVSSAKWPSLLQDLQSALTPEAVASVKYYRDTAFAAALCGEYSDAEAAAGKFEDAALYTAASKTLHTIVAGQGSPTPAVTLETLLAQARLAVSEIEAAQSAATAAKDYSKAAELQALRASFRLGLADAVLQGQPGWPLVTELHRFDLPLHRLTTHYVVSKKWFPRFFLLRGSLLYFSDGTQGHPDSREGTLAFMQLDPAPDGRYCVDVQGMRAAVASASLCNAAS